MKSIRIFTGSYDKCKAGNLVSISANKGRSVGFTGDVYTKLAPKKEFWNIWRDNIGKVSEDENNIYYMREYYNNVLSDLDANEVVKELQSFGDNVILLCFESEHEFCHRHLVAVWLEKTLNIEVREISVNEEGNVKFLERNQKYVKQFNDVLDFYMNKRKE